MSRWLPLSVSVRSWPVFFLALAAMFAFGSLPLADDPNECDAPGDEPDVLIADLHQVIRNGSVGDITAFSVGTNACNIGTCWLNWIPNSNEHPVIGVNLYRLMDSKLEQVGMSWLKHGFYALSNELCDTGCVSTNGWHLGVNCSDPYSAELNGAHERLAPRFEINPYTGDFPFPGTDQSLTGDAIYKRLQVHNVDLDPALNPGAEYYTESFYITADDHAAGNAANNASYRPVDVWETAGEFFIGLAGVTQAGSEGIQAWLDNDTGVKRNDISAPGDGPFIVLHKASELPDGKWHYEYAIENLQSHRAARSVTVPVPAGVLIENVGFHDVDYHSGSPIDGTDWEATLDVGQIPNLLTWQTVETYAENPYANALFYGTTYNFRYDSDAPPSSGHATLGLFRPGAPEELTAPVWVPDPNAPISVAGAVPRGDEPSGVPLTFERGTAGDLVLRWGDSCLPTDTDYAVYEGAFGDFTSHVPVTCSTAGATTATITPSLGSAYYLIVPNNGTSEGSYGVRSDLTERPAGSGACEPQSVGVCW